MLGTVQKKIEYFCLERFIDNQDVAPLIKIYRSVLNFAALRPDAASVYFLCGRQYLLIVA